MSAVLQRLAASYDALSLRERVLVAVALLALVGVVLHTLALGPHLAQRQRLGNQIVQGRAELATIENEVRQLSAQIAQPDAGLRARLADVRNQLGDADSQLRELESSLVPPHQVTALLQRMLARRQGLHLVSLRTLTPVAATGRSATEASAKPEAPEAALFRHGVEIAVSGSYAELVAYLAELERLPQRLFWSRAVLRAGPWPTSTLTLTVFTLSTDKAWLTV